MSLQSSFCCCILAVLNFVPPGRVSQKNGWEYVFFVTYWKGFWFWYFIQSTANNKIMTLTCYSIRRNRWFHGAPLCGWLLRKVGDPGNARGITPAFTPAVYRSIPWTIPRLVLISPILVRLIGIWKLQYVKYINIIWWMPLNTFP